MCCFIEKRFQLFLNLRMSKITYRFVNKQFSIVMKCITFLGYLNAFLDITDEDTKEHNQVSHLSVARLTTQNHAAQKFALGL